MLAWVTALKYHRELPVHARLWVTALKYHHELHAHARLGDGVKIPRRARERNTIASFGCSRCGLGDVLKIPSIRLGD